MNKYVFLAHDPGGYDAIYPVALALSKSKDNSITILLSGQAGEKQPLFRKTENDIILRINELIEDEEDFVLITGTSWGANIETEAIKACKENGHLTISILDYWSNYSSRFLLNDQYCFPDYLFVMDDLAFNEAVASGVDRSIMRITGNPGLDSYVQRNRKSHKRMLFISQPLSVLYGNSEGYTEFDAFEGVLKAGKQLGITPYIKMHPKENPKMIELYEEYKIEGALEDVANEFDVVVGMSTMGLLQCSLMGIPVISYEPNLKADDKCIINRLGITKGAYSFEELIAQLKAITGSIEYSSLPFWYDGKSTERCVDEIIKISNHHIELNK